MMSRGHKGAETIGGENDIFHHLLSNKMSHCSTITNLTTKCLFVQCLYRWDASPGSERGVGGISGTEKTNQPCLALIARTVLETRPVYL